MQLPPPTLPTLTRKIPHIGISRRRIAIIAVFALTLLVTIAVVSVVLNRIVPTNTVDAAAEEAMRQDLAAEPSAPVDADLITLGFKPDDATDAALVPGGEANTAASAPPSATATTTATATSTATVTPPVWDHKGRVNILLMGLDGLSTSKGLSRADTLIVLSIDPEANSAAMIGIPRDTFVTINTPRGAIRNRINSATVWGDLYKYPGGGAALQMRTVSEFLGIPIHYYVSVYFDGFKNCVDAIGGIDIDVPTAIRDSFSGWSFNAGMQHMDGSRALKYARSRYSTSDFSRGRRQMLVLLAARDKVLKADIITKLPALLPSISGAFRTDLSIPQLIALASVASKIDLANIKMAQVDETMQTGMTTSAGARVLVPKMDKVKAMVKAALMPASVETATPVATGTQVTAAATAAPTKTPATAVVVAPLPYVPVAPVTSTPVAVDYRTEGAKVEVLNGTNTIGLARKTQTYLLGQGVQVVHIADASGMFKKTTLYDDGTRPATKAFLIQLFNIAPENVKSLGAGGVNIRLVMATDAKIP